MYLVDKYAGFIEVKDSLGDMNNFSIVKMSNKGNFFNCEVILCILSERIHRFG